MEIKTNDLFGDFATVTQHNIKETRLRICEAIIEAEETSQAVIVQNHLSKIIKEYLTDPMWKARVELARAGSYFLKSDYLNTAQTYLSASR